MAINRSLGTKNSVQNNLNWTFDEDFGVLALAQMALDKLVG